MSYNFKKIADLEYLNEKPDGASVVIETEGAVKRLQADKVGVTSWNGLEDKPFGETTVKGDTLTWDGNTEGLVSVDADGMFIYHVSDAVPTIDDFANGCTLVLNGESYEYSSDYVYTIDGLVVLEDMAITIAPSDNYAADYIFPKAGIYFMADGESYISSLTIPGYNGFETTTIKPIETKYLPEHLQFGTETKVVEGDTLTWDGNTEGLYTSDFITNSLGVHAYKVFDTPISAEQLIGAELCSIYEGNESKETITAEWIEQQDMPDVFLVFDGGLLVIFAESVTNPESGGTVYFGEPGIYFQKEDYGRTISITIPGYTGFTTTTTVVKPIETKYLPDSVGTVKTINGQAPDENGNVTIEIPDPGSGGGTASAIPDDEMLEFLMDMDIVQPVSNVNNSVFTDANDKLYVL